LPTHAKASDIVQWLGANYQDYKTFAFVRNPYDACVSAYHYVGSTPFHPKFPVVSKIPDFDSYVDYLETLDDRKYQSDYICDASGRILVDRLGRFESLHADFQSICEWIGIPCDLPHKNRVQRQTWESYYTADLKARVYRLFRQDFEYIGYTALK
jgi:hypothetical protein